MKTTIPILVALVLSTAAASAQQDRFELVPGVVVDSARDALYLMSPGGGVEGLSVSSGNRLWASERAAKPLALHGDLLIAQVEQTKPGGGLEILMLDTTRAGSVRQQFRVELPAGVWAAVDDGLGRAFDARGQILNNAPFVSWTHTKSYSKGVAPKPDEPLRQSQVAAYSLDLSSARMVAVEPSALAQAVVPLPPAAQTWMNSENSFEAPAIAGSVVAATQVVGGVTEPLGRLVLKRWDRSSGAELTDVELLRGPHILRLRSADGRHLLVTERVAPNDFEEYEWSVFSIETGVRVGQLRHHQSHARFFVSGSTIVFEEPAFGHLDGDKWVKEPRRLRAAVLGSGSAVWEQKLRDTAYRGPFPP